MPLEQDLLAMERALWSGGPEAFRSETDAHCLVVFTEMAGVMAREDIAQTAEEGRWTDVVLTPRGFIRPSDTVAIIAYDCTATRRGGQRYRARVGSGYVKRDDGWKLVFHQQTPVT